MNAVIYARYSSDKQNEMSIEGQIRKCKEYAEEHDMFVVQEYIDRAQTATTDKRPNFLRMIEDSEYGNFEVILVYQLDRFARNKNDSGYYKKILARNGVKVVSAMEHISNDSSGVITEGLLEVVNEYFSQQLSEKVTRGMNLRAEQFKYNGGAVNFGYTIDSEGHYIPDKVTAPIVVEIFERIADGDTMKSIVEDLNKRGIKTSTGSHFKKNSLQNMVRNEKYRGVYKYGELRYEDAIPRLVSDELFYEVQEMLGTHKHSHRPAIEEYLLSGKLYCGRCRKEMVGTSGTSHTGRTYRYYTCLNSPKKCDKKNVKKEYLEDIVMETCRNELSDEIIDAVLTSVREQNENDKETALASMLATEIKETEKKISRIIDQIEDGQGSVMLADRLRQREDELSNLRLQLKREEAKQIYIEPDTVRAFLVSLRNGDIDSIDYRKMLVRAIIDRIYLYDDHFKLLLNHSGRKGKANSDRVKEVERYFDSNSSTTTSCGAPRERDTHLGISFALTYF
ncbi:MAG: recombinase family protein [Mogibacterium sp.]|nr:recombinase family protein [Mogibacterium sp.]